MIQSRTISDAKFFNPIADLVCHCLEASRQWIDNIEIRDRALARLLCQVIPVQCPFARDIIIFGRKIGRIPPLCKLNPLYEQLMGLRFRAACYLVEQI
jgi:Mo-dependent nitrogenase C-terminus